jgi:LacI family transcriptional regulator
MRMSLSESREPVSLSEVAQAAKVSLSTASRALARKSMVAAATRARVVEAAEKLGYRPNPFMRTLMSTRRLSKRLPFRAPLAWVDVNLRPDDWRIHMVETKFYEGASHRASERGYELKRYFAREPQVSRPRLMQVLKSRGVHGALFSNARILAERNEPLPVDPESFALVSVGCRVERPNLSFAMNDCFASARLGHKHLLLAGYRRPVLVTAHFVECFVDYRFVGGFRSLSEEAIEGEKAPVLYMDDFVLEGLASWLKAQHADSVLFTCVPKAQAAFMRQVKQLSRDFGYASLDYDERAPSFAGVDQCHAQVGSAAADLLINQLEHSEVGLPLHPHGVMIEGEWRSGASVPGLRQNKKAAKAK